MSQTGPKRKLAGLAAGVIAATAAFQANARVYSGLEVFLWKYTNLVKGKRVALLSNQTGVDASGTSTVALMHADKRINLRILFAPEHGIYGNLKAGETVAGGTDRRTGLSIVSLYGGKDHKPPPEALDKIDVVIYDIQDVGSRSYTYIWHLAECMKAAAETSKEVIVLDRPNVFGASSMDGPVTEDKFRSFIGLYPVPRVYGMTVGELARHLNQEERINCRLTVIPMLNYRRGMTWRETGLPWVPPSPNIPNPEAAMCFAATGSIGETGSFNLGLGTPLAFQVLSAAWLDANSTASSLNSLRLPGVLFRPISFKFQNSSSPAVQICVTSPSKFQPVLTEIAMLSHFKKAYPYKFKFSSDGKTSRVQMFDKAMGTDLVRRGIEAGWDYRQTAALYQRNLQRFRQKSAKYLLYK